ncbi:MAG: hypothetical protein KGI38_07480 [Thaumarchaeota archaeon]|nr:hypothetical protein [Nitrososphaerota archaeon]
MSSRGRYEDFTTLLYMVPFILSGVYGIYLWAQSGISAWLPASAYLAVTRDPTIFILGSLSVMLGLMIEVSSARPAERPAKLISLGSTLQYIAAASLILVLVAALYANGFTGLSGAANDFIIGRYGLVFPTMMVLLSYLVTAQVKLSALTNTKVLAIIALLLVPASIYEIGKRDVTLGLGIALALLVVGLVMYLYPERKAAPTKKE